MEIYFNMLNLPYEMLNKGNSTPVIILYLAFILCVCPGHNHSNWIGHHLFIYLFFLRSHSLILMSDLPAFDFLLHCILDQKIKIKLESNLWFLPFVSADPMDQDSRQRVRPFPGLQRVQWDVAYRKDPEDPGRPLLLQGWEWPRLPGHQVHQSGRLL